MKDAPTVDVSSAVAGMLRSARALDEEGRPRDALAVAWQALDRAPDDSDAKRLVVRLLHRAPDLAEPGRSADIARLLTDGTVDPSLLARAGWQLQLARGGILANDPDDPEALSRRLESCPIAIGLLRETHVPILAAELALTRLRRWLLLSGRWEEFPGLVAALAAQATHNGGAWLFDDREKALLDRAPNAAIALAYLPGRRSGVGGAALGGPVTRRVAHQYRNWPFPPWSRAMADRPTTLPAMVEKLDQGRPSQLPVAAEVLVAGCGTGREAALIALGLPHARITAIDISEVSLAYAAERCAAAGLGRIEFRLLDIHRVAELDRCFDFIACSGVLHHLSDPEAGWARLADILRPQGVMHVMVYSKLGRMKVRAARKCVADLRERPVDDDLLRQVRRRLIEDAPHLLADSADFYTLAGVHDLVLHPHEDPFDIPRIARALDRLGLELLAFELPSPAHRARYRREHPSDPSFRDVGAWARLERTEPFLFSGMYKFWCRKPTA